MSKTLTRPELLAVRCQLHGTVVFTNGCFDILHIGHVRLLKKAESFGDWIVVAINSDSSIRHLKGPTRPIFSEKERSELLASLSCVDFVTIFDEPTPLEIITEIQPDILVKGGDYKVQNVIGRDVVESYGGRVEIVPLIEGYSTTQILKKLKEQ